MAVAQSPDHYINSSKGCPSITESFPIVVFYRVRRSCIWSRSHQSSSSDSSDSSRHPFPMLQNLYIFFANVWQILMFDKILTNIENVLATFCQFFDYFLTAFWQLCDNLWQLFDQLLNTFWQTFEKIWQLLTNYLINCYNFWQKIKTLFI
jgi:phage-related protein